MGLGLLVFLMPLALAGDGAVVGLSGGVVEVDFTFGFALQFDGGCSGIGLIHRLQQIGFVIGEDVGLLLATGNGNVELLPIAGGEGVGCLGNEDVVNGFTLGGMRG